MPKTHENDQTGADDPNGHDPQAKGRVKQPGEVILHLLLLGVCLFVWTESADFDRVGALWPRALAVAMAAAIVLDWLGCLLRVVRASITDPAEREGLSEVPLGRASVYFAVVAAFAVAGYFVGLITVVPLLCAGFMMVNGYARRFATVVPITIVVTAGVFMLFNLVANIPLTEGALLEYYPSDWF